MLWIKKVYPKRVCITYRYFVSYLYDLQKEMLDKMMLFSYFFHVVN